MAQCLTPFGVKDKLTSQTIPVPCGNCPFCRSRRASGWSFRLMQQDKIADSSHFITLTYDTKHVPISKNGFMELCKRDLQLFFKRLRKSQCNHVTLQQTLQTTNVPRCSTKSIKYYAVGEYGGTTKRPHYHIILFNAQLNLIQPAWDLGHVHYGTVAAESVGYTLKYISKPRKHPMHRNDDREPEFSLMSKGLGANYLSSAVINYHKADPLNRMCIPIEDGKKIAMPRYYKNKIFEPEKLKGINFQLKQKAIIEQQKLMDADPDYFRNKAEKDKELFAKAELKAKQNHDKL